MRLPTITMPRKTQHWDKRMRKLPDRVSYILDGSHGLPTMTRRSTPVLWVFLVYIFTHVCSSSVPIGTILAL